MYFSRLIIKNFLIIRHADIDLTKRGIVEIQGTNLDQGGSNGSGKSSVSEALLWALFGETIRGYKTDEVILQKRKKDCCVELHFEVNSKKYTIKRYRKHREHKDRILLFEGSRDITGEKNKDTQKEIIDIIGVNFRAFTNYVVFGQGESNQTLRFAEMTDVNQKKTLEALLPTYWIDDTYRQLSKYSLDTQKELSALLEEFNNLLLVTRERSPEEELMPPVTDINEELTLERIREAEDKIFEVSVKLNEIKEKLDTEKTLNIQKKTKIVGLIEGLIQKIKFFNENTVCPECGNVLDEKNRKKKIAENRKKIKELEKEFRSVDDSLEQLLKIQHDNLAMEKEELKRDKQRNEYAMELYHRMLRDNESRQEIMAKKSEEYKKNIKSLQFLKTKIFFLKNKLSRLEFWKNGFSPKGFRSKILDEVVDELTDKTNEYLQALSNSGISVNIKTTKETKSGKIQESIDIAINNVAGTPTYSGNSGGERQRIDLALLFAIRDISCMFSKVECNILFLDEIFKHLDSEGVESIRNMMETVLKDKVDTVFVVSYLPIEDMFDSKLIATREDEESTIQWAQI